MKKKNEPVTSTHAFGALADALAARGFARPPPETPPVQTVAPLPEPTPSTAGKVVVRRETKGRRGKTVTTIGGLALSTTGADELVRKLKSRLGTGATVDGGLVVVQGDLVDRVAAILEESGIRRVVRG